jgi:hypothetical protein
MIHIWPGPRAIVGLVAAAAVLCGSGCFLFPQYAGTAKLEFEITAQPEGGYGVNKVSCTFQVRAVDSIFAIGEPLDEAITLTSIWPSTHGSSDRKDLELTYNGDGGAYITSKSAPTGAHLDKPFWVEFYWEDVYGAHSVVSDTAYCQ